MSIKGNYTKTQVAMIELNRQLDFIRFIINEYETKGKITLYGITYKNIKELLKKLIWSWDGYDLRLDSGIATYGFLISKDDGNITEIKFYYATFYYYVEIELEGEAFWLVKKLYDYGLLKEFRK